MEISSISIDNIKPYTRNAKKHTDTQIAHLMYSVEQFDFTQPLVIDEKGVIIIGHARFEAAKRLHMSTLPCLVVTGWSESKKKACRLADNQINMETGSDFRVVKDELVGLIEDFSMGDLGFDLDDIFKDKQLAGYKQSKNMDNFFKMTFDIEGNAWGIPETDAFVEDLSGIDWLPFGEKASVKDYSNVGIHFYIDDYKFESVWSTPDKWIDMLQQCRAVVTPDFSNYSDMPKAQQLWNHYRRQWCGRYWQDRGVRVISSLSWANGQVYDWCFLGIPKSTICAVSFVSDAIDKELSYVELQQVLRAVECEQLFVKCNEKDYRFLGDRLSFSRIPNYEFKG